MQNQNEFPQSENSVCLLLTQWCRNHKFHIRSITMLADRMAFCVRVSFVFSMWRHIFQISYLIWARKQICTGKAIAYVRCSSLNSFWNALLKVEQEPKTYSPNVWLWAWFRLTDDKHVIFWFDLFTGDFLYKQCKRNETKWNESNEYI